MTGKKPSSLSELLSARGPELADLAAEAQRLEALRRRLIRVLPADSAPHCLGADLKDGALTLFMDSGAWTTALRYRQAELLAAARQTLDQPCHSLRFKVLPDPLPGLPPKPAPKSLSADTRKLLANTAEGIVDPLLAAALRRLAGGEKP
ncbi:MAG: DciA family protein [Bacillota bacterium]